MTEKPTEKDRERATEDPREKEDLAPEEVCTKAPEWAEHQRLEDDDMPCDDGRSGKI